MSCYGIEALMAEGFRRRTIRYYIAIGLLPRPQGGRGRGACYTEQHLRILREIRRWRDERRTLADIREWACAQWPWLYR